MAYELWETSSKNMVGDFPTQAAALAEVREALHRHSREYVMTWVLAHEDEQGETTLIADGIQLVELAQATPA